MQLALRKLTMYSVSVLLGAAPKPSIPSGKRRGLAGAQHNRRCCSGVFSPQEKYNAETLHEMWALSPVQTLVFS